MYQFPQAVHPHPYGLNPLLHPTPPPPHPAAATTTSSIPHQYLPHPAAYHSLLAQHPHLAKPELSNALPLSLLQSIQQPTASTTPTIPAMPTAIYPNTNALGHSTSISSTPVNTPSVASTSTSKANNNSSDKAANTTTTTPATTGRKRPNKELEGDAKERFLVKHNAAEHRRRQRLQQLFNELTDSLEESKTLLGYNNSTQPTAIPPAASPNTNNNGTNNNGKPHQSQLLRNVIDHIKELDAEVLKLRQMSGVTGRSASLIDTTSMHHLKGVNLSTASTDDTPAHLQNSNNGSITSSASNSPHQQHRKLQHSRNSNNNTHSADAAANNLLHAFQQLPQSQSIDGTHSDDAKTGASQIAVLQHLLGNSLGKGDNKDAIANGLKKLIADAAVHDAASHASAATNNDADSKADTTCSLRKPHDNPTTAMSISCGQHSPCRVFSTSTVAMCFTDILSGRILDCNDLFAAFFGFTRPQITDTFCTFLNLTHPKSYDQSYQIIGSMLANVAAGKNEPTCMQKTYVTVSGQEKHANLMTWIACDNESKPVYAVTVIWEM